MRAQNDRSGLRLAVMLAFAFILPGCGGGTSGTGSGPDLKGAEKVFRGNVTSAEGAPVAGAQVTEQASGTQVSTDTNGEFNLATEVENSTANFLIETPGVSTSVSVPVPVEDAGVVRVDVKLSASPTVESQELIVESIGGNCDGAFGPPQIVGFGDSEKPLIIIDQIKRLAPGTVCTVYALSLQQGQAAAGVGVAVFGIDPYAYNPEPAAETPLDEGLSDQAGRVALDFPLPGWDSAYRYLVVEAPTALPRESRVGIVINPYYPE